MGCDKSAPAYLARLLLRCAPAKLSTEKNGSSKGSGYGRKATRKASREGLESHDRKSPSYKGSISGPSSKKVTTRSFSNFGAHSSVTVVKWPVMQPFPIKKILMVSSKILLTTPTLLSAVSLTKDYSYFRNNGFNTRCRWRWRSQISRPKICNTPISAVKCGQLFT